MSSPRDGLKEKVCFVIVTDFFVTGDEEEEE